MRSPAEAELPSLDSVADAPSSEPLDLYRILRWTVPFHIALPLAMVAAWSWSPEAVSNLWIAIHLLFPLALVGTYRWWVGQGEAVFLILVINHVITFVTFAAVGVWMA